MVRRWLVLAALMFWQGGFAFYGAVVVPTGSAVLGSHRAQAQITRPVTNYLNLAGALALGVWAWEIATTRDASSRRWRLRWALWSGLVLLLGLLVWLHGWMDERMDLGLLRSEEQASFRLLHIVYLNLSTLQWGMGMILLAATLSAWRSADQQLSSGVRSLDS